MDHDLRRLERRAVRTELHPLLSEALSFLREPLPEGPAPAMYLSLLAEVAFALLSYRKPSHEQRALLHRISLQPSAKDAEFVMALLASYLQGPAPSLPGFPFAAEPQKDT